MMAKATMQNSMKLENSICSESQRSAHRSADTKAISTERQMAIGQLIAGSLMGRV